VKVELHVTVQHAQPELELAGVEASARDIPGQGAVVA
jgi:hypothetical protein